MHNINHGLTLAVLAIASLGLTACGGGSNNVEPTIESAPAVPVEAESPTPAEADPTRVDPRTCYISNNNVEFVPGGTNPENVELVCGTDPSLRAPLEVTRTGDGRGDVEVTSSETTLSGWDIVRPQATMGGPDANYLYVQVVLEHPDVEGHCVYIRDFSMPSERTETDCPNMPSVIFP